MKITPAAVTLPALALALFCGACDAPTTDEEIGEEEELGEAEQAACSYWPTTPSTPDATGTLVGTPNSAWAQGYGAYECDLYQLRATAAPSSGDKVGWVEVSAAGGGHLCTNVSGIAKVWTKQLGFWSLNDVPLTFTTEWRWVHGVNVPTCVVEGSVFYGVTGSSSITEVQVGARIGTSTTDFEVNLEIRQPGL